LTVAVRKISVAVDKDVLRQAKNAAEEEGLSLSGFITRAMRSSLEEREREKAGQSFIETFSARATAEERRALLELWDSPPPPVRKRRRVA
jgi:hypothetical protein